MFITCVLALIFLNTAASPPDRSIRKAHLSNSNGLSYLSVSGGADVKIDYTNFSVKLCMEFPVIGGACVGW